MPLLRNRQTGNLEFVGDKQVAATIEAGTHAVDPRHPVALEAAPGVIGSAGSSEQLLTLNQPVQPEAARRASEAAAYEQARYDRPEEAGAAFTTGLADAATLGLFSAANRLGGDEAARSLRQHRGAYTAGQVVGAVATGRPGVGLPAGQAARAGAAITEGGGIARTAAGLATEGALQGAGQGLADAMLEDEVSVDRIVSSMATGAVLGGGVGGAIGGVGGLIAKARRATQSAVDAGIAARAAEDAALATEGTPIGSTSPLGQIVDDVPTMDLPSARKAEKAELGRIDAEREAEAEAIVGELETARAASKSEQPWIALKGVTGKSSAKAKAAPAAEVAPAGELPGLPELPALKPKKLSAKPGYSKFDIPRADGPPIPMRIRAASANSDLPGRAFEKGVTLHDDLPKWTHVEVQQKLDDGWATVGSLELRHRGDDVIVAGLNTADQLKGAGLEDRLIAAAERRLGRRISGGGAHDLDAGPVDDFLGRRQQKVAERAIGRGQRVPSWEELTAAGRPVVSKTVDVADLAPRLVSQFDISPVRRAEMAEAWRAAGRTDPVILTVHPGGGLDVNDNYGRLFAAMEAGEKKIRVELAAGPGGGGQTDWTRRLFPDAPAPRARAGRPARIPVSKETEARIKEALAVSFKADKKIDRILENPKEFAAKPRQVQAALTQQERAYEKIAELEPELRQRILAQQRPGRVDKRLRGLDALPANLDRNRRLQARVRAILADPDSPRLTALRGHREDVVAAAAQPKSLAQSLTEGATFAGATAMAAPLGMGAPLVGAHVARTVGEKLFRGMAKAKARAAQATSRALDAFVKAGRAIRPAAVPLSTRVLSETRFGPAKKDRGPVLPVERGRPAPDKLTTAFMDRRRELLDLVELDPMTGQLAVRQDARQQIADGLVGVAAFGPVLADRLETALVARIEFLARKLPHPPDLGGMQMGPDLWRPSSLEMRTFARFVAAAEDPDGVEQRVADATISPEDAEAYRTLYPDRFADFTAQLSQRVADLEEPIPFRRRLALSILTGQPIDPSMSPPIAAVLQAAHSMEPGTGGGANPPTPQPQFGSIKAEDPTSAQQRSA